MICSSTACLETVWRPLRLQPVHTHTRINTDAQTHTHSQTRPRKLIVINELAHIAYRHMDLHTIKQRLAPPSIMVNLTARIISKHSSCVHVYMLSVGMTVYPDSSQTY